MNLEIDADVKSVAEFMQRHIAASRLVPVANAVRALAPTLWGHHVPEDVAALRLRERIPTSGADPQIQSTATEQTFDP